MTLGCVAAYTTKHSYAEGDLIIEQGGSNNNMTNAAAIEPQYGRAKMRDALL
jgi:hypothetical protein